MISKILNILLYSNGIQISELEKETQKYPNFLPLVPILLTLLYPRQPIFKFPRYLRSFFDRDIFRDP